jgi:hypothetical protein
MTSEREPLLAALRDAFTTSLTSGEVDVVEDAAAGEVEVIADDWTLHLEGWPLTAAWFALDDDPASPAEQRAALSAALSRGGLPALRDADARLDGALTSALASSGDALSVTLTMLLRE